jgi:hypothetical protein
MVRVLTPRERPAAVAAEVGGRERTVRKRLAGYTGAAAAGVADRWCRPRHRPIATPPRPTSWVARRRRQRGPGAQTAQARHLSTSTVALMAAHTWASPVLAGAAPAGASFSGIPRRVL